MRILVTGHEGFIGKSVFAHLKQGHEVVGFDLKADPKDDVTDYDRVLARMSSFGPSVVLHLAAQAFIPVGESSPSLDCNVNVWGTLNVCRAAKAIGTKVVYHSSGAVYGDQPVIPVREDCVPNPQSFYGVSKLCAETYVRHFWQHRGLEALITRFSSVSCPGRFEGPVYYFCRDALQKGFVTLTGDGLQSRDITHIDDVLQGIDLILNGKVPFRNVYNIASGHGTTMLDLARHVFELLGKKPDIRFGPARPGDIGPNWYDCSRMEACGYRPTRTVDDCIRLTLKDFGWDG